MSYFAGNSRDHGETENSHNKEVKMDRKTVKDWQKDHNSVVVDQVQVWSPRGTMLTDCMSKADARILVKNGFCYVVDQQAIRQYDK
jgi:3-deoxy-D-arabino-heptulosonate 7-phosphate (DAHP) synthase